MTVLTSHLMYLSLKASQRIPSAYGKACELADESFVQVGPLYLKGLVQLRVQADALTEDISPLSAGY